VRHYHRYLLDKAASNQAPLKAKLYGAEGRKVVAKPYWYSAPSTTTLEGRESVQQGLLSNAMICFVKGVVWVFTGSQAIFTDLMHSCADVANYMYRLSMLRSSASGGDVTHPYGYAPLRYIVADRSFVMLFGLGFVIPLGHASAELLSLLSGSVHTALAPDAHSLLVPTVVFLASAALEGVAMRTAFREIARQSSRDQAPASFLTRLRRLPRYLREGPDVMSVATFVESASGMVGAGVGLLGLALTWWFQSGVFDLGASLIMASVVGWVSTFLMRRSSEALLGQTLPVERVERLVEHLEARQSIVAIYDVKTHVIGTDMVRFKAEVQFNPEAITRGIVETWTQRQAEPIPNVQSLSESLGMQLENMIPKLQQGVPERLNAEDFIHANNALFYEALAFELKETEHMIRGDLQEYKRCHIDLEPW